ncbi:hypothetical protein FACS1894182_00190 [Bacteroidia bacterium]|nr:hypothetical protein FACS1894182_00190 [Bacteroidia bacterium]
MVSCSSESIDYGFDEYHVEFATALENNAFLLDTGQTVYDGNQTAGRTFASGDRLYLYFSYGIAPSDPITVHGAGKVFSDTLRTASENKILQSPNDPIRFESAWVGSHYLNLKFYMEYHSQTHKLALVIDEALLNQPEIHLYFMHDKNNDAPGYPAALYASYNLSSVLGKPEGNRTLFVHFNTTNYGNKICTLKY